MIRKHCLIGGGTGFIGTRLRQILSKNGYEITVISRMPGARRITWHELEDKGIPKGVSAIVNLAGQNVLDPSRRWTPGFKQNVWNSRINTTASIAKAIIRAETEQQKLDAFVNVSGVSIYKPDEQRIYTEDDTGENYDFMSKLCVEWEKASRLPEISRCRQINIRSGVVIGRGGGMIQSIYLPFWLGLGGPMGKGTQPLPWIHIDDLCELIRFVIENPEAKGIFNGVSPEIATNAQFSKEFATALYRPCIFRVPDFAVDFIFGKERSVLLLAGPKIAPKHVLDLGFKFKHPTATLACRQIVEKSQ